MCAIRPAEDQTLNEARAKIIWGESIEEVREWLSYRQIPSAQIEEVIATCLRERAIEFRKKGIKEIVIAALILILPIIVVLTMYFSGSPCLGLRRRGWAEPE